MTVHPLAQAIFAAYPVFCWALVGLVGACLGSFANVCIYRIPRGMGVGMKPSHCPRCGTGILPRDNIPFFGFFLRHGQCRYCGSPFGIRYAMVELTGAILAVLAVGAFGASGRAVFAISYTLLLLIITLIDFDHQIIPDELSLGGAIVGLLLASSLPGAPGYLSSLVGAVVGAGTLFLLAEGYYRLAGIDGLGGGDVKLMAAIGAFQGVSAVFPVLFIAACSGVLVMAAPIMMGKAGLRSKIPFGPFLCLGSCIELYYPGLLSYLGW